jgi:hypothetical protein
MDLGRVVTVASPPNPSAQVTIISDDDPAAPRYLGRGGRRRRGPLRRAGAGARNRLCPARRGVGSPTVHASRAERHDRERPLPPLRLTAPRDTQPRERRDPATRSLREGGAFRCARVRARRISGSRWTRRATSRNPAASQLAVERRQDCQRTRPVSVGVQPFHAPQFRGVEVPDTTCRVVKQEARWGVAGGVREVPGTIECQLVFQPVLLLSCSSPPSETV